MFKANRSEHNKIWDEQRSFGVKAKLLPNVASNLPLGSLHVCAGVVCSGG